MGTLQGRMLKIPAAPSLSGHPEAFGAYHPESRQRARLLLRQPADQAVVPRRHQFQDGDGRAGPLDPVDLQDFIGDAVEVGRAAGHHLGHEVRVAGSGMHLDDLRDRGEPVLHRARPGLADGQRKEGHQLVAERGRVQPAAEGAERAAALQPRQPGVDGVAGDAECPGECQGAGFGVLVEGKDDPAVEGPLPVAACDLIAGALIRAMRATAFATNPTPWRVGPCECDETRTGP